MTRKLASALVILCALAKSARTAQKPPSIGEIDFKNFLLPWNEDIASPPSDREKPWHWLSSIPEAKVRVVNGMHHFYEPHQSRLERERSAYLRIVAVTYGKLNDSDAEGAAVQLNYGEGGTANWDYLYVYRSSQGRPKLLDILQAGSRGYGGLYRTAIQAGLLVVDFADPSRMVGDCCSEGYIRVHYHWKNGTFIEDGPREHGDINLSAH